MTGRFGEKISDQDAYATARGAAGAMSDEQLNRLQGQQNGPNQQQAIKDEIASRQS